MRALERAKVIERRTGPKGRTLEYRLTPAGRDLKPVVQAIGEWGATWSLAEPRPEEIVKRMDEVQPALLDETQCVSIGFVEHVAVQEGGGTIRLGLGDFDLAWAPASRW